MNTIKQRLNTTAATTTTTPPSTATTTSSNLLLNSELRYITMSTTTGPGNLLQVYPVAALKSSASGLLQCVTANSSQTSLFVSTNGSNAEEIFATSQPPALTAIQNNPGVITPLVGCSQSQYITSGGVHGTAPLPLLNHDLVKQIVVGNTRQKSIRKSSAGLQKIAPRNQKAIQPSPIPMPPLRKIPQVSEMTATVVNTKDESTRPKPSGIGTLTIPELLYISKHTTVSFEMKPKLTPLPTTTLSKLPVAKQTPTDAQSKLPVATSKVNGGRKATQASKTAGLEPGVKRKRPLSTAKSKGAKIPKVISNQSLEAMNSEIDSAQPALNARLLVLKPQLVTTQKPISRRPIRSKSLSNHLSNESITEIERRYSTTSDSRMKPTSEPTDTIDLDSDDFDIELIDISEEKSFGSLENLNSECFENDFDTNQDVITFEKANVQSQCVDNQINCNEIITGDIDTGIQISNVMEQYTLSMSESQNISLQKFENSLDYITSSNINTMEFDQNGDDLENDVEFVSESMAAPDFCDDGAVLGGPPASTCATSNLSSISLPSKKTANKANIQHIRNNPMDTFISVLNMMSAFNMLIWKERIGRARGTTLSFRLNNWNLIEVNEKCLPRDFLHTTYEKPICEREGLPQRSDPLLYLCRRCRCHGPAADFLAPEFCSLECLNAKVTIPQRHIPSIISKRPRKEALTAKSVPQKEIAPKKKCFRWSTYLTARYGILAAPVDLFLNPFPSGPNAFQVGMKLEAIDPDNCALFCVCTITEIQGYRLKLNFDGYDSAYDFWVNADSMDIFPPGWCAKTNRILQPPKRMISKNFNWATYLATCTKAVAASRHLFTHLNSVCFPSRNPFKVGMLLEAEDLNDSGKLCVATVADVLDDRIRVHFDGWDECYDYWVHISSPYIHPCGYHERRHQLIVPPEYTSLSFNWRDYLHSQGNAAAAKEELFVTRDPISFKPNMKLEVVDPRNPIFIRPATVVNQKGTRLKLHLDCWPSEYCFWLEDDSPDLHPIGWCDATGHILEPPPGYQMRPAKVACTINGCRGYGNAKRFYLDTHASRECCPYLPANWRQKIVKPARINIEDIVRAPPACQIPICPDNLMLNTNSKDQKDDNYLELLEEIQQKSCAKPRRRLQQKRQSTETATGGSYSKKAKTRDQIPSPTKSNHSISKEKKTQHENSLLRTNGDAQLDMRIEIAKEYLYDYGPRLAQNYKVWQKNFVFNTDKIKRNPMTWTTKETSDFVRGILNNECVAKCFMQEDIDGLAFLLLQQSDLTDLMDLKMGPALKLYSHILQLRTIAVCKFGVK